MDFELCIIVFHLKVDELSITGVPYVVFLMERYAYVDIS